MVRNTKKTETGQANEDSGHPDRDETTGELKTPPAPEAVAESADAPDGYVNQADLDDPSQSRIPVYSKDGDRVVAHVERDNLKTLAAALDDDEAARRVKTELARQIDDLQEALRRSDESLQRSQAEARDLRESAERRVIEAREEGRIAGRMEYDQAAREAENRAAKDRDEHKKAGGRKRGKRFGRAIAKFLRGRLGIQMANAVDGKFAADGRSGEEILRAAFEGDESARSMVRGVWGSLDFDRKADELEAAEKLEAGDDEEEASQPFRTGADEFQSPAHREQLARRGLSSSDVPPPNPPSGDAPDDYAHKNESAALPGQPIGPLTKPDGIDQRTAEKLAEEAPRGGEKPDRGKPKSEK